MKDNIILITYLIASILLTYLICFSTGMYKTFLNKENSDYIRLIITVVLIFIIIISIFVKIHVWAEHIDYERKLKRNRHKKVKA